MKIRQMLWGLVAAVAPVVSMAADGPVEISGRYPHLAMFNTHGECGTGAVVPWADRLWVITYAPHEPKGSTDKLYEISSDLSRVIRPESVGGTPANRMIHAESNQLIIGPYFIDDKRNVRVIPPSVMPGRLTATARHLTDPANKVYTLDMEGMFYEVDVHSLAVNKLSDHVAPGAHGKGAYTGQHRLLFANNGNVLANKAPTSLQDPDYAKDPEAAGILAEWDGTTWHTVERRQFTDITGPGGIRGAPSADAPVWAIGWDKRSVLLKCIDEGQWSTYRLPISDYSYAAAHGWYTEWPRIREVTGGHFLMNMHGGWFEFPKTFSSKQTAGIRPIADYLKITADFAPWQERIVFGCDDASVLQNPLLGQSQSNLWFTTWDGLKQAGRPMGFGGPWVQDDLKAGEASTPYLFAGYTHRTLHVSHGSDWPVTFVIEVDKAGNGHWDEVGRVTADRRGYAYHVFADDLDAQWVRVTPDKDCEKATAYFSYGTGGGAAPDRALFASVTDATAEGKDAWVGGTLRPTGKDRGTLLFQTKPVDATGRAADWGPTYEVMPDLTMRETEEWPSNAADATQLRVTRDEASLLVLEGPSGKWRWRLPRSTPDQTIAGHPGARQLREVVTERSLLNAGGTFYLIPRDSAYGALRMKPIASHNKYVTDFCSWRGLLVLAGNLSGAKADGHFFPAPDGKTGLWFGDVDDLWKFGKPTGHGGPWLNSAAKSHEPSDPYLMAGYDRKTLTLSHDAPTPVKFTIEVDVVGDRTWHLYQTIEVPPGKTVTHEFPAGYSAQWVRLKADTACRATAQFDYE